PGATMACTGVGDSGVCVGAQACATDGMSWGACDCGGGNGTGGAAGTGGAGSGGESAGGNGSGGESTGGASTGGTGNGTGGVGTGGAGTGGSGTGGSGSGGEGMGGVVNNGNYLIPDGDAWVDPESNDVGVQGFFWSAADESGSSASDVDAESTEGQACVDINVVEVNESCGLPTVGDCYTEAWGAVLGFN